MAVRELKYSNTNTYLIGGGKKVLLFDTGWAGTFDAFCKAMGEINIPVQYIDYILISHFHPDHCGIAQDIADLGPEIIVMDVQEEYIHAADRILAEDKRLKFTPIDNSKVKIVQIKESRKFLKECGIDGQIMHTPGHSDDSISLCLDEGSILVGDLNPLYELEVHKGTVIENSWNKLLALGPHTVFYGHAKTAHPTPAQLENALKYVASQVVVNIEDEAEEADGPEDVSEVNIIKGSVSENASAENISGEIAEENSNPYNDQVSDAAQKTEAVTGKNTGPQIIQLKPAFLKDPLPGAEPVKTDIPVPAPAKEAVPETVFEKDKVQKIIPAPVDLPGPQPALLKPAIPQPDQAAVLKPAQEAHPSQPEVKNAQPSKNEIKEPLGGKELHKLVERIMKNIDKGYAIEYIAQKTGSSDAFVENVARMYLTHPGVGVQGILDRIELIGINARRDQ